MKSSKKIINFVSSMHLIFCTCVILSIKMDFFWFLTISFFIAGDAFILITNNLKNGI